MIIEPFDWNVIVVGYWNLAILTPSGVARRLFQLPEKTPIVVEVPFDGLAPHRVRHGGIIVAPESGRLTVMTDILTLTNLEHARQIASRAVKSLPETPFIAAGFNVRFKLDDSPERLLKDTAAAIDTSLSDAGFKIKTRIIRRSLEYEQGTLNLEVWQGSTTETKIELNFHLESTEMQKLCEWLEMPNATIEEICSNILTDVVGLTFQEDWK